MTNKQLFEKGKAMAADLRIARIEGEKRLRARGSYVLLKIVSIDTSAGGIALPSTSKEARRPVVVDVGCDVKDLKVGDEVQVLGNLNEHIFPLSNALYDGDYCYTLDKNIALVIEKDDSWKTKNS